MEVWKDIPGYEGIYQVSTEGRIYSTRYRRYRKLGKDKHGYSVVGLNKEGGQQVCFVHRIVASTFIPNPELKAEVNHIDSNKQNNSISNLEWVSHDENMKHSAASGLRKRTHTVDKIQAKKVCSRNPPANRRLSMEQAAQIRSEYKKGIRGFGYTALARKYYVTTKTIRSIIKNETYIIE